MATHKQARLFGLRWLRIINLMLQLKDLVLVGLKALPMEFSTDFPSHSESEPLEKSSGLGHGAFIEVYFFYICRFMDTEIEKKIAS